MDVGVEGVHPSRCRGDGLPPTVGFSDISASRYTCVLRRSSLSKARGRRGRRGWIVEARTKGKSLPLVYGGHQEEKDNENDPVYLIILREIG